MPVIKSAIKKARQDEKHRLRNQTTKRKMKELTKAVLLAVKSDQKEGIGEMIKKAESAIDTAKKKNLIHKNTAGRKKSRLRLAANKLLSQNN